MPKQTELQFRIMFSDRLLAYLEDNRMSRTEFGQMVGATPTPVRRWARGEALPSQKYRNRISRILGISDWPPDKVNVTRSTLTRDDAKPADQHPRYYKMLAAHEKRVWLHKCEQPRNKCSDCIYAFNSDYDPDLQESSYNR